MADRRAAEAARLAAALLLSAPTGRAAARHRGELLRYLRRLGDPAEPFPGCPEGYAAGLRGDWRAAADGVGATSATPTSGRWSWPSPASRADARGARRRSTSSAPRPPAALVRRRLRELGVDAAPARAAAQPPGRNPAGLTDRQVEILRLLADGLTNAEIAERLVVSVRTVDHHVSAVLQKLGVPSRQAARAAAGALDLLG